MIPGLEHAEFIRYGVMHRNTFLESPAVLTKGDVYKRQLYATEKALAHTPELEAFAGKTVLVTEPVAQKLSGTKTSQDV